MDNKFFTRGFQGKRTLSNLSDRLPPGQYMEEDFPVLSAGPSPSISLDAWRFTIRGLVKTSITWNWQEFQELPSKSYTKDIHCVTKWSKLDTHWLGVSVDTLLSYVELVPNAQYVKAYCYGGYTTNIPLVDITGGKAFIAYQYEEQPLATEHGGPARLVIPHLYFWKSAKWIQGLQLMDQDRPGFWENFGYHMYGDPWKEQRYQGD